MSALLICDVTYINFDNFYQRKNFCMWVGGLKAISFCKNHDVTDAVDGVHCSIRANCAGI